MTRKIDYIIVGQGIAGTWLSYELIKRGYEIMVFNKETNNSSTLKAAGLYNPITGRKMVKTWRADDFFPSLEKDYRELEELLKATFLYSMPIYRPFRTFEDQNEWQGRQGDSGYSKYLQHVYNKSAGIQHINDQYGGILLSHSGYVDLPTLVKSYRIYLTHKECYRNELLDANKIDWGSESIRYEKLEAKKIIFCEGADVSSLWRFLPFKFVRGEIMDVECELIKPYIINRGIFMIPKNNFVTIGSTYDHLLLSYEPQEKGIENLKVRLEKLFAGTFKIIEKRAGIRPATYDRKPFIGFHKTIGTLGIFNGFGTKGVSLVPYFARHFVDVLEKKSEIDKEANVERVF